MSIWAEMDGWITIPKKEKVSVKELIEKHFTDEYTLKQTTKDRDTAWAHTIYTSICIDGGQFLKNWYHFEKDLKATEKDLTCTIRFL